MDDDLLERLVVLGGAVLLRRLRRFVFSELVAAERSAEREVGDVLRRDALPSPIEHDMRVGPLFAGQEPAHGAAEIEPILRRVVRGLAGSHEHEPREFQSRRREKVDGRVLLALEPADRRGARQKPLRGLVELLCRRSELRPLLGKDDGDPFLGQAEIGKGNRGLVAHRQLLKVVALASFSKMARKAPHAPRFARSSDAVLQQREGIQDALPSSCRGGKQADRKTSKFGHFTLMRIVFDTRRLAHLGGASRQRVSRGS